MFIIGMALSIDRSRYKSKRMESLNILPALLPVDQQMPASTFFISIRSPSLCTLSFVTMRSSIIAFILLITPLCHAKELLSYSNNKGNFTFDGADCLDGTISIEISLPMHRFARDSAQPLPCEKMDIRR